MAYETLIVEIEDYVALIRLNRPESRNALSMAMVDELRQAMMELRPPLLQEQGLKLTVP